MGFVRTTNNKAYEVFWAASKREHEQNLSGFGVVVWKPTKQKQINPKWRALFGLCTEHENLYGIFILFLDLVSSSIKLKKKSAYKYFLSASERERERGYPGKPSWQFGVVRSWLHKCEESEYWINMGGWIINLSVLGGVYSMILHQVLIKFSFSNSYWKLFSFLSGPCNNRASNSLFFPVC